MPGAISRVKEPRTGQVSTCSRKSRFRTWGGDNTFIIKSSLRHHLLSEPQAFRRVYCATRVSGFSLVWVASFSTWQIEDKIARGGSLLPYPRSIACCSKRCRETFSFLYSHSLSLFLFRSFLSLSPQFRALKILIDEGILYLRIVYNFFLNNTIHLNMFSISIILSSSL